MSQLKCIAIESSRRCTNPQETTSGLCLNCYAKRTEREVDRRTQVEEKEQLRRAQIEEKEQLRQKKEKAEATEARKKQRQEIEAQKLYDKIVECRDVESLRQLELKILAEFVTGMSGEGLSMIDPKFGSPIVQLLKHQAELLGVTKKGNEGLKDPKQREVAINIAVNMSPEQQIQLLGDFATGMKLIEKQAKIDAIDIGEAVPVEKHEQA